MSLNCLRKRGSLGPIVGMGRKSGTGTERVASVRNKKNRDFLEQVILILPVGGL
jgi:hypothetical protein